MKKWQHVILLLVIQTTLLGACSIPEEQPTSAPITYPIANTPTRTSDATSSVATSPPSTILPQYTATIEAPDLSPTATELSSLTVTTAIGEPDPLANESATPTILPPATTASVATDPLINFFQANVEETDPGRSITLSWATTNVITVTLWRLAPTGQFNNYWAVAESGTFDYPIAMRERNRTTFALSATGSQGNSEMATVAVTLRCPDEWFYSDSPDICPATAAVFSAGAEQHFERGTMIWLANEDRIYVLFNDGQQYAWTAYTDDWDPGIAEFDPQLAPPAGFYQPVRGFGLVWREQPGVRNRLGWAITEEFSFDTVIQRSSYAKYNETYIRAIDGGLWRLMAERSAWEQMSFDGTS